MGRHRHIDNQPPNKSPGCVKSADSKIGNDPKRVMANFDEVSRRIRWSKNEFSHRLTPEPTAVGAVACPVLRGSAVAGVKPREATPLYGVHVASRRWLNFLGCSTTL